jgi:hypothetical protein
MDPKSKCAVIKIRLKRMLTIKKDILFRHKLSHLKETAKNIPSKMKYIILFLFLILLDYFIIVDFVFNLTTTTEKTFVSASLFAFNSVIITGFGIMYQVEANNKREVKFKIHRQRKARYDNLIEEIKNGISPVIANRAIENTQLLNASQPITDDQKDEVKRYVDYMFDLMLYGSPELVEKRIKQRKVQIENDPHASLLKTINSIKDQNKDEIALIRERESMYNLIQTSELLLQMRKEIGFEDRSISARKMLALILDNIDDPEFDQYFIDMNVPLN